MKTYFTFLLVLFISFGFAQNEKILQFISVSNDVDTCQNSQVKIVANFIDYDSLKWQKYNSTTIYNLQNGGDYTGVNNDTLIINQVSGVNNYRCIAYNQTDSIISDSIIVIAHVNSMSLPAFINISEPCSAELIVDNAAISIWSTGDTTSSAIYVNTASNQYYSVNAVDEFGCTFFDSCFVIVNEFSLSLNKDTVCQNEEFIAEGTSNNNGWTSHFSYQDTDIMNSPVIFNSLNIGVDTVYFWVTGFGCTSDSIMKEVVTIENIGSITRSNDTLYSNNAVSYQWFFNDSILINETNNYIIIDSVGLYEVEVLNINECTKKTFYYNDSLTAYSVVAEPNEICSGDTSRLITYKNHCLLIDFNDSTLGTYLTTPPLLGNPDGDAEHFINHCTESLDGSTYFWISDDFWYTDICMPRDLTTIPLDITSQDFICFDFMMPQQPNTGLCDAPDKKNEGVSLQYSTDYGTSWEDITYFCPDGNEYYSNTFSAYNYTLPAIENRFNQWDNYCYYFPPSSISSATMIRWYQSPIEYYTAFWFIDNIFICSIPLEDSLQVEWYDEHSIFISDSNQTYVTPSQTTDYMNIIYNPPLNPDTLYVTVNVNPLPNPIIYQNNNDIYTDTYTSYQWFLDTGLISGANNYLYTILNDGYYSVEVTDTNGCVGNSDTTYFVFTSINHIDNDILIKLYPNPAKDFLIIENKNLVLSKIEIFDFSGKVLIRKENNSNRVKIDISELENGVYFININDVYKNIKFIK